MTQQANWKKRITETSSGCFVGSDLKTRLCERYTSVRLALATMAGLATLVVCGCTGNSEEARKQGGARESTIEYPQTRRVDHVDVYHGTKVPDPYRWLEADVRESTEVADWVAKQNDVARAYLDAIPARAAIERRLTELWNYERHSPPTEKAGRYFYLKNDGLQNQSVLYIADSYDADGRVLVDPNQWSEDGTVALTDSAVSDDGRHLAYARSEAGSDWEQIHVLEIGSGEELTDVLKWVRFSSIAWDKQGGGFYYSRYPEPAEGQQYQSIAKDQRIYFHKLGDEQSADQLIYSRPDEPDWSFSVAPTDDGKFLMLSLYKGTDPQNQVFVRPTADADGAWTELIGDFENQFSFVGNEAERFYFLTDLDASTKRIVAMDLEAPGRDALTEIVAAGEGTIESASILSGRLIVESLVDVLSKVRVFDMDGKPLGDVELPGLGSVSGFGGDQDNTETFYTFASYNTAPVIYRYDVASGDSELVRQANVKFNPDDYIVEQVFYHSKDGTRVPMMLAHRRDLAQQAGSGTTRLARPQPTLLYAYGGFNISIAPRFSPDYIAWMDLGGILAVANLRGGGEYGEEWHQAGKLLNKQNVFDDFIAAAEWLIDEGYTSGEKLAVMGGSNGGLLVGAVETQRPELFGACIPVVGVMDMLRFHRFTAGQFWRDEFGSADDPQQFKTLYAYSPYHNIKEDIQYPATMVMTADTDDRVVPMHSFKFGAALQRAHSGTTPILLRIEIRAGHGAGTPTSKRIENAADRWAFLVKTLGMEVPATGE